MIAKRRIASLVVEIADDFVISDETRHAGLLCPVEPFLNLVVPTIAA
jgi:hypothetical protein